MSRPDAALTAQNQQQRRRSLVISAAGVGVCSSAASMQFPLTLTNEQLPIAKVETERFNSASSSDTHLHRLLNGFYVLFYSFIY